MSDWGLHSSYEADPSEVCPGKTITYFLTLRNETQGRGMSRKGLVCHMTKKAKDTNVTFEHYLLGTLNQGSKITSHLFSVRGKERQPRNKKEESPHTFSSESFFFRPK